MIGEIILQKRKELGLTQSQLADMLQVTAPAVNKWEKNLTCPDVSLLSPLARCLKTDLNELFSFYNCLSDKERKFIVDKVNSLLIEFKDDEALVYIDEVIHQNLSDGLLHKQIADALHGFHVIKRINQPNIYLEELAHLYERALELLPEDYIDTVYGLITIHSEMGNKKRAKELLELIPEKSLDKSWIHLEMLYMLKEYDTSKYEAKKYILDSIIELINNLNFLKNILIRLEDTELIEIVEKKEKGLIDLFEINPIVQTVNNISNAYASKDTQAQIDAIAALIEIKKKNSLSSSILFKDVTLDDQKKYISWSNSINDLNNWDI